MTRSPFRFPASISLKTGSPLHFYRLVRAHPFNALIKGMQSPGMVQDTTQLIKRGIEDKVRINVIVNNRAGGNAPPIAQQVARAFLAAQEVTS